MCVVRIPFPIPAMNKNPQCPATNAAEPQSRTEAEVRDWYSRAERGKLIPNLTPEETRQSNERLDSLLDKVHSRDGSRSIEFR